MNSKKDTSSDFYVRVWKACSEIPKGNVSTYKEIAHYLGCRAYRAVGTALKNNPHSPDVPCHRVVASSGGLGGFAGKMRSSKKIRLLEEEGVVVKDFKIVDFSKKLHKF